MTHIAHPRPVRSTPLRRWLMSTFTVLATIAAAVGALIAFGPDNSRISVFSWTWEAGDVSDTLAAWLMIGGGMPTAVLAAWGLRANHASRWLAALEAVLVVGGIGAAVLGVILLV